MLENRRGVIPVVDTTNEAKPKRNRFKKLLGKVPQPAIYKSSPRKVAAVVDRKSANREDPSKRTHGESKVEPGGATVFPDDYGRACDRLELSERRNAEKTPLQPRLPSWRNARLRSGFRGAVEVAAFKMRMRPERDESLLQPGIIHRAQRYRELVPAAIPNGIRSEYEMISHRELPSACSFARVIPIASAIGAGLRVHWHDGRPEKPSSQAESMCELGPA